MNMANLHFRLLLRITFIFIGIFSFSSASAGMDINAYEYQRKFEKTLSLGDCPYRQVAVAMSNGTLHAQGEKCTLHKKGIVRSLPRALSDTRNELITSVNGVVVYLGLCGGEAASYLGILHDGECVAVEIASRLTFGDRTVVRAFVGYYRTALDILDTTTEKDVRPGMELYYKNKYYVKNRSYGTLEIIFVQFRFWNNSQASAAKEVKQSDPKMSTYMEEIKKRVGEPKSVRIISLSTASKENYKMETKKEWNRALRYVQILEMKINNTRAIIAKNKNDPPHLKYELFPFIADDVSSSLRVPNPILWENTSIMEVTLRQAIQILKKLSKKCRKNNSKVCRRVRTLKRNLKSQQAEVHKGRSAWVNLTPEERNSFIKRYSANVETFLSVARRLARGVRVMKRKEKRSRLKRKRERSNKRNQIPPSISGKPQHRIRHLKRKLSKRKNRKNKPQHWKMGWF